MTPQTDHLDRILSPVIILATLRVANVIVWESGLSFLGLSVPPPTPTWGRMLSDGRAYLANAWWTATFSGLAIMVTVLDKHVTLDRIGHFARGVVPNFPRLRGVHVIRTWAGLRPATPDNHPIIQLLEEPGGFCLASGHSRRGIGYAPGTGQLVAQILTGKSPSLPLEPFALGRFAMRPPEETATR